MRIHRLLVYAVLFFPALARSAEPAAPDPTLPKCPADWRVEVVAQSPQIKHPSVVCCAPDGRIFMAEDPMDMGEDSKKPLDRILCFHPDGKVTEFAAGLHAVFGLQYIDGKLYVHHTPKFSVFTDDHGIGRDRRDLIACTNPNPAPGFNDHIPANCRLAMDGYLYVSTGDKGVFGAVGTDGSQAEICGGGVFRLRPDGTELEVYSTGTRNHLDVAINSEDELFTYDNTDDGNGWWTRVTHMVDGGFYGYPYDYKPRRPYTLWMMTDYGGGSPTGALAYNEDALPAAYRGNLFLCEWGRKQLLRLTVDRQGASYRIVSREDFLTSGTAEFRPVGIAVAPDGMSLVIADWNFSGWKRNEPAGRLLKVTYTGASQAQAKPAWYVPAAQGQKHDVPLAELIAALSHPAQSVRLVAQRRLAERGPQAVEPLVTVLGDARNPPHARWSAIWALDAIDRGLTGRAAIIAALADREPSVRRQAARELGTRRAREAIGPLAEQMDDECPAVRFQAATALGRIGQASAVEELAKHLGETDLFTRYSIFTALNRIGRADPQAWQAIARGLRSRDARVREGALFALRETWAEPIVKALAGLVAEKDQPADSRAAAVAVLADLVRKPKPWDGKWWGTQPVKSPRPERPIDWRGTPPALAALRSALLDDEALVQAAAIRGLSAVHDVGADDDVVRVFRKSTDTDVRQAAIGYFGGVPSEVSEKLVLDILAAPRANPDLLLTAIEAAEQSRTPEATAGLVQALAAELPADALVAAIEALGNLRAKTAVQPLVARLHDPQPPVRQATVAALAAIGGQEAAGEVAALLDDLKIEIRRAAILALGTLQARAAIPQLLRAGIKKETRFEVTQALAEMPDARALDLYLDGLGGRNNKLRNRCSQAVAALGVDVLPEIESRLEATLLGPEAVSELQQIFSQRQPITNWKLLGPFANPVDEPFPVDQVPLNAEFRSSQGKPIHWVPARLSPKPPGHVNLARQLSVQSDATAYAVAELNSPVDRDVEFVAGSDDSLTLWLNGEKIFAAPGDRAYRADEFQPRGRLRAGSNVLLAKIGQRSGGWEFSVAYLAPRNSRLFQIVPKKLDPSAYAQFAAKTPGRADQGRELFADLKGVACVKCHRVRGEGGDVGPDLLGVGAKYNRQQLIEAVLYPSKQILDGYRQTTIVTDSGAVLTGILRSETDDAVSLVDPEGKKLKIPKDQIEQREEGSRSVMPDGLNSGLSLKDFSDIVSYLESLKEKPAAAAKP